MNSEVTKAMRQWNDEVDAEMVRLLHNGVAPWDAIDKAVENVSKARRKPFNPYARLTHSRNPSNK